jgi:PAS domain S-box-containing protein
VPLMVEGKTIGAMVVQHYTDPQAYGEREQHMLEFVSTQVAIAIQRKQAEEALRESEQRFRILIEKAPVAINISRNGNEVYANQKDLQMFGLSGVEEIIGRPVAQFLAPQSRTDSLERTRRRARGLPTPVEFETVAFRADGSQFPIQVTVDMVQLSDGPANLAFITDIAERKQAQALQEAVYQIAAAAETTASMDELYSKIHQSISSVMPAENFFIALYDEAQNLLKFPYIKDAADEIYLGGIEPGRGTTAYVLRTGKSLLCTRQVRAELERRGEMTLQGEPSAIWLGVPLIVEGKTIGAMVVQHYTDPNAYGEREQHILEFVSTQVAIAIHRKQSEEALRESEIRYRGLFEDSPVSLWEEDFSVVKRHIEELRQSGVTDFRAFFTSHPDTVLELVSEIKVLDVNAATVSLLRATHKDQLIGNLKEVIRFSDSPKFVDELTNIAQGLTDFAWEGDNYNLDGEKFAVSMHWSAAPGYEDTLEKVLISLLDITARKRAEEAKHASERRYRGLFENSPVSLWEQDFSVVKRHIEELRQSGVTDFRAFFTSHPDMVSACMQEIKVLDVNAATVALYRATNKDQLIGSLEQIVAIDDVQNFVDELVEIAEGKTEFAWEGENYAQDGEKLSVSLHWSAAPGYEDSLEKVLVSIIDVTERKQAEIALQESEEKFRSISEQMNDMIYLTDDRGIISFVSPAADSIFGYTPSEMQGHIFSDFLAAVDIPKAFDAFKLSLSSGQASRNLELSMCRKDGSLFIGELNGTRYQNGAVIGTLGLIRDITERKQEQVQLEQAEARYRLLFENAIEGIFQTTPAGQFMTANPALLKMLGYDSLEEMNATTKNLEHKFYVHPGRRKEFRQVLKQGGEVTSFESEVYRKDGSTLWISENARLVRDNHGKVTYYEGTLTDVTARKQAEDALRQLNANLEQRVEERTRELRDAQEQLVRQEKLATLGQLAGGVGHELRNPLGVINSAVYYLKLVQPDVDEKIKKYHLIIEQEVNTAGRIINDLLDFGRIVSPDRQPVSVPELLQRVLTRFPLPASVNVQLKIPASLPKVFADPLHLEQVLGNLTTNACQAMKEGGTLTISARSSRPPASSPLPAGPCLMIAVKDTGTGISPENMKKLFEPLFTTKVRGIGLGLAVSKKLAEANRGTIAVRSEPGKGSTFSLFLPVKGT